MEQLAFRIHKRSCQRPQLSEMRKSKVALTARWRSRNVPFFWPGGFWWVDSVVRGAVASLYLLSVRFSCRASSNEWQSAVVENSIRGAAAVGAPESKFGFGCEAQNIFSPNDFCARALFLSFGHVRRVRRFGNGHAFSQEKETESTAEGKSCQAFPQWHAR